MKTFRRVSEKFNQLHKPRRIWSNAKIKWNSLPDIKNTNIDTTQKLLHFTVNVTR